ncbi:hypothetical protein DB347_18215 [Opitutaceae bacterium EW11]|nr:hypothetical protein DB347_18215 [Opitutaceae bacterium EW11]
MTFFRGLLVAAAAAILTTAGLWWLQHWAIQSGQGTGSDLVERRLASASLSGQNVLLPAQVDEATLRWCLAEEIQAPPQIAMLGSSHTLQLSSADCKPYRLSNFSLSGGFMQDHLVTTEILDRRGKRPRVWVLMVDSWFFDYEMDFRQWRTRPHELAAMEAKLSELEQPPLAPIFRNRVADELRPRSQASLSLSPILSMADNFVRQHTHVIVPADVEDALGTVLTSDGAIKAAGNHSDISVAEARSIALHQYSVNRDRHRYGIYPKVDDQLWALFERWVQFLKADGAQVVLVLSPYHPAIYGKMTADPKSQLKAVETRVRRYAPAAGVRLVGSYDPNVVGVGEADFFDGDHLREEGLRTLLGTSLVDAAKDAGLAPPADVK